MELSLIALGANLGNRKAQLEGAWNAINELDDTRTIRLSSLYETEPEGGPPNQPQYLNATGVIETLLDPFMLLEKCQEIEKKMGRVRHEYWGPRTIDIDILLYADYTINTELLVIPHPRMHIRRFVLEPAVEVAREMRHPVLGQTVAALFATLFKKF
ncbi:MAG: 2-amino-4-hydroxy-6-hydroxymethyldihydropteridine diphosphokinase [Thermoguttaceae bacterium]